MSRASPSAPPPHPLPPQFFDLFNFFYFSAIFGSWRQTHRALEGKMEILLARRSPIGKSSKQLIPPRGRSETYAIRELAAAKDIKLKVVKKILRFQIFNLFPITFSTFSWVFFANVFSSSTPAKPRAKSLLQAGQNLDKTQGRERKKNLNKIIYCFSICEIPFDYNPHISIIFRCSALRSRVSTSTLR